MKFAKIPNFILENPKVIGLTPISFMSMFTGRPPESTGMSTGYRRHSRTTGISFASAEVPSPESAPVEPKMGGEAGDSAEQHIGFKRI